MVLKHVGIGFEQYWSDPFNVFDGLVVLVSIVFVFVPGGAIAGLFRIGRVFRLIKRAPQLRALMTSMIMTVPAIINVFAVLLLLFFIFAVIGTELFGNVRHGFAINQDNNYQTWAASMLALWRGTLGNWRSNMYDTMVEPPFCTTDFTQTVGDNTFKVDDCGKAIASVVYHVAFQVFSTFAVLNVVIAIILGAFTWCYSLEQSELTSELPITADDLRHFKAIWDRFDLYSTGLIDVKDLQLFLAVVRYNIPQMFSTGVCTQKDQLLHKDYSSWGSRGIDPVTGERLDALEPENARREAKCRANYYDLLARIGDFERSQELWKQLNMAGCDVWMGGNDNVAGFDIKMHPLGSVDANLHIFCKEVKNETIDVPAYDPLSGVPAHTEVKFVRFMSLINILVMEPLDLTAHDTYVCFDYKDPFSYFQPGYFGDKYPGVDGKVCLNTDPMSIRNPMEMPAYYKKDLEKITEDDMLGTYVVEPDPETAGVLANAELISDDIPSATPRLDRYDPPDDTHLAGEQHKVAVVTAGRGIA